MLSLDSNQQKVSSIVHPHHVIRVTELLEQSVIQSLLLTHHCYQWRLVVKLAGRAAEFHLWLNI